MPQANITRLIQKFAKLYVIAAIFAAILLPNLPAHAQISPEKGVYRLAVFGDSLTAGYKLPDEAGFAKVLEQALIKAGHKVQVINASVSGDTSTGGLSRLDWSLNGKIDGVILELGANDMLRGIKPEQTGKALDAIITRIKAKGANVLLAGMLAAPGMGKIYENQFNAIYKTLAQKHEIPLIPFFLEGVAGNKNLNLADGIHPNAKGVQLIVRNILPLVEKLIAQAK